MYYLDIVNIINLPNNLQHTMYPTNLRYLFPNTWKFTTPIRHIHNRPLKPTTHIIQHNNTIPFQPTKPTMQPKNPQNNPIKRPKHLQPNHKLPKYNQQLIIINKRPLATPAANYPQSLLIQRPNNPWNKQPSHSIPSNLPNLLQYALLHPKKHLIRKLKPANLHGTVQPKSNFPRPNSQFQFHQNPKPKRFQRRARHPKLPHSFHPQHPNDRKLLPHPMRRHVPRKHRPPQRNRLKFLKKHHSPLLPRRNLPPKHQNIQFHKHKIHTKHKSPQRRRNIPLPFRTNPLQPLPIHQKPGLQLRILYIFPNPSRNDNRKLPIWSKQRLTRRRSSLHLPYRKSPFKKQQFHQQLCRFERRGYISKTESFLTGRKLPISKQFRSKRFRRSSFSRKRYHPKHRILVNFEKQHLF